MKIGILTYHRSVNYGAFLQAYALQKYVQHVMGETATVELVDYNSQKAHELYISQFKKLEKADGKKLYQYIQFQRCVNLLPKSKDKLVSDDLSQIQSFLQKQKYDVIIAGSDEIWKVNGMRGFPNAYWMNFDLGYTIKASYAASSRNDMNMLQEKQIEYMQTALKQFSYIGVRDRITQRLVQDLDVPIQPALNCDPTFLYSFGFDKEEYGEKVRKKLHIPNDKKIMGIMIKDDALCSQMKRKYEKTHVVVSLLDELPSADYNLLGITPFEWLKTIGIMDMLVTNRFHGTVFAIKNHVPFLSVDDYDGVENSKIYDLLSRCGLEEHYFPYQNAKTPQKRAEVLNKMDAILQMHGKIDFAGAISRERLRAENFKEFLQGLGGR